MDYAELGKKLGQWLHLERQPVSITFMEQAPASVPRLSAPAPASCAYWKRASDGAVFYTTAGDHLGCTVGAYTHGAPLPAEKAEEMNSLVGRMIEIGYLRADEVGSIPHRASSLQVAVYAPLVRAPFPPDVVILSVNARGLMLLSEAARAAGIAQQSMMGRPTCAFIPAAIESGSAIPSSGCIGNRVYTALSENDLYFAIPGSKLESFTKALEKIVAANGELQTFHEARNLSPSRPPSATVGGARDAG
jgi:uncharacterized protein (DUF169 family)